MLSSSSARTFDPSGSSTHVAPCQRSQPSDAYSRPAARPGRQGADRKGAADHRCECLHHRRAQSAPLPIGPHSHGLDVTGAQRPDPVEEAALHDRAVGDDRIVLLDDRVDAAEGVLPVVIVEVARERRRRRIATSRIAARVATSSS